MKRLFKLETNMKLLNKLNQSLKRQWQLRNSNKLLEILTILKKFFKLSTDLNKLQLRFSFKKKNSSKFHIFWKRQSKRLQLCLKLSKFSNTSTKSLRKKNSELPSVSMLLHMNKDLKSFQKTLKLTLIYCCSNLENYSRAIPHLKS